MATRTDTATIGVSGAGTVTIATGSTRRQWTVTQVSVELASAPLGSTCALRFNGNLVTPLIATGDIAAGDPPVVLGGSDVLTVEWAGCISGTVGRVLTFYDEQAV